MNTKKAILFIVFVLAIISIVFVLNNRAQNPNISSGKLQISAGFYPLAFFAKQIGGDRVQVFTVTPAGAEPHDYEPSAKDITTISRSKILFLNGGGMEPWEEGVKKNLSAKTTVFTASDIFQYKDPHYWLSPNLSSQIIDEMTKTLSDSDSTHASEYQENALLLKNKLAKLDNEYKTSLANCSKKEIITSHDAFGHLASSYGFKQVSIAGLSPEAEPSSRQLADISAFARSNDIQYIFFESLVSPKLSETIAQEIGAKTLVLNPIEGLTKDEISSGKDYFTEMKANLINLQIALQCKS